METSSGMVGAEEILSRERCRVVKSVVCDIKRPQDGTVQPPSSRCCSLRRLEWVRKGTSRGVRYSLRNMSDSNLLLWRLPEGERRGEMMEGKISSISLRRWIRHMVSRVARSLNTFCWHSLTLPSVYIIPSRTRSSGIATLERRHLWS